MKDSSGKARYVRAYVFNEDFFRLLEKTADGFDNLRTGKRPQDDEE
jgi:hypothetical protein